jgi:hypothetical protein
VQAQLLKATSASAEAVPAAKSAAETARPQVAPQAPPAPFEATLRDAAAEAASPQAAGEGAGPSKEEEGPQGTDEAAGGSWWGTGSPSSKGGSEMGDKAKERLEHNQGRAVNSLLSWGGRDKAFGEYLDSEGWSNMQDIVQELRLPAKQIRRLVDLGRGRFQLWEPHQEEGQTEDTGAVFVRAYPDFFKGPREPQPSSTPFNLFKAGTADTGTMPPSEAGPTEAESRPGSAQKMAPHGAKEGTGTPTKATDTSQASHQGSSSAGDWTEVLARGGANGKSVQRRRRLNARKGLRRQKQSLQARSDSRSTRRQSSSPTSRGTRPSCIASSSTERSHKEARNCEAPVRHPQPKQRHQGQQSKPKAQNSSRLGWQPQPGSGLTGPQPGSCTDPRHAVQDTMTCNEGFSNNKGLHRPRPKAQAKTVGKRGESCTGGP